MWQYCIVLLFVTIIQSVASELFVYCIVVLLCVTSLVILCKLSEDTKKNPKRAMHATVGYSYV